MSCRRVSSICLDRMRHIERCAPFPGEQNSTFTALRHRRQWLGAASYPLGTAVMVHGFDTHIAETAAFSSLLARVRPLLDELGLELEVVRTNSKEISLMNWEFSHAAQLAACLHNWPGHSFALLGSSEPYRRLVLPWGSNPATDYLLSGDRTMLVHDGAGFTRAEKLEAISAVPAACRTLKVCSQPSHQDRNCGKCEKCVRTQTIFLALGMTHAPCFDEPFDPKAIAIVPLYNEIALNEMRSIYEYAQRRGIEAPWVRLLARRLAAGITKRRPSLKKRAKRMWRWSGLRGPARRRHPLPDKRSASRAKAMSMRMPETPRSMIRCRSAATPPITFLSTGRPP